MPYSKVVLAVAAAVAAIVASGLTATAASAQAGAQPPGLDHFLCYSGQATDLPGTFNPTPAAVRLSDQFDPRLGGPRFAAIQGYKTHCNPVEKTIPTGQTFPPANPAAHLGCWGVKANAPNPHPFMTVLVENQFGNGRLRIIAMKELCLPTWKNETQPQFPTPTEPPGLDHFTCYRVAYQGQPRFTPPAAVTLRDQFGELINVPVGDPYQLCLPAEKTHWPNQPPSQVTNPEAHLLCFKVDRNVARNPFIKNQFGLFRVQTGQTRGLCLPSYKVLQP